MKSLGIQESFSQDIFNKAHTSPIASLSSIEIDNVIEYPSSWTSQVRLDQYLDVPMHLLFHGINKSMLELISEYLSKIKKGKYMLNI